MNWQASKVQNILERGFLPFLKPHFVVPVLRKWLVDKQPSASTPFSNAFPNLIDMFFSFVHIMPIWIKLVWPNPTQLMMHCLCSIFSFPDKHMASSFQWNINIFSRWILYRQSSGFTALKSFTNTMNNYTKVIEIITDIFSNFWLLTECHTTI